MKYYYKHTREKKSNNQAFLILSDCVSESLIRLYLQIKAATAHWGDTFIVYHNKANVPEERLQGYNVYEFTNSVMTDLGYRPISDSLVPGSNHFPIIKFHLDYPDFDYYWCIEDDIIFSGEWSSFFNKVIKNIKYDLITSFVKHFTDNLNPAWHWWDKVSKENLAIDKNTLAMSFNPIYSLSNRAASFLDQSFKNGWKGHHEVMMATLLISNKFKVKDFGGVHKFVPKGFKGKYYTGNTHAWRPSFKTEGELINKIYHPVKNKFKVTHDFKFKISFCITGANMFSQIERTIINNILDNHEYKNLEFIILDQDFDNRTELWVKEHLKNYIHTQTVVYYKTVAQLPYNSSYSKNVAFRLASGDIVCSIDANQYMGLNLAELINEQFKINSNIVINNLIIADGETCNTICVKKDDFLYSKGFDEQLSGGDENTDFVNRLELSRIRKVSLDTENHIPVTSISGLSFRNVYITLNKTLVQYIDPATSNIVYLYHTGNFEMGVITNNSLINHPNFRYSYVKRNSSFQYKLKTKNWIAGKWRLADDDETLILKTNDDKVFHFVVKKDFYETIIDGNRVKFYNITHLDCKKSLVDFNYFQKNKIRLKKSISIKGMNLNNTGFGHAIVYKDFNQDYPVITGKYGKEDSRWLSISIFASRTQWQSIIKNAISPLTKLLYAQQGLISFKLMFNYQSGENIRLALLISGNNRHKAAQFIDQYLNKAFKKIRTKPRVNKDIERGVFLPFHKNSVQYGLYPIIVNNDYKYLETLEQALSNCIMEAFADDIIDEELLLTFIIYILFECYKVINASAPNYAEKWLAYNRHVAELLDTTPDNNKLIHDQYDALKGTIDEIYLDVLNSRVINDLPWVSNWERAFNNAWEKVFSAGNPSLLFCLLIDLVNQHLNPGINFRKLVHVFIDKALNKSNDLTINEINGPVFLEY